VSRFIVAVGILCLYGAPARAEQPAGQPMPITRLAIVSPAPRISIPEIIHKAVVIQGSCHITCKKSSANYTCPGRSTCTCSCDSQGYAYCSSCAPPATTINPPVQHGTVCNVQRPLLKAGDNVGAAMAVSTSYPCGAPFNRSDSGLTVITAPSHGVVAVSNGAAVYKSQDGYKGADSFTLLRRWPEGGTAVVTFAVSVVD